MRVTALTNGNPKYPESVQIYRISGPYMALNDKTKHEFLHVPVTKFNDSNMELVNKILDGDIIVLQRVITDDLDFGISFCQTLKSRGAKLVYESDDDLTQDFRYLGVNANSIPFLSQADAITATNEFLAKRLSLHAGGVPWYVLPNYIPVKWFTNRSYYVGDTKERRKRQYPGTFNIMLAGTPSHEEDWRVVFKAVMNVLDDYPYARLLFGGYKPDYIPEHDQIIFLPYVPYQHYPAMLFEADVVCAGIEPDDNFNKSKSPCKVMEAWAAQRSVGNKIGGAAVVATDSSIYSGIIEDEKDGLLTEHTISGWEKAIRSLIEDDEFRNKLQINGLKKVRRYSIKNHADEWLTTYIKILMEDNNGK